MGTTDYPLTPLGELLMQGLERSGLPYSAVTDRIGVSPSTWNNIVYGGHELRGRFVEIMAKPDTIAKLAFALGVDIKEALALRGYTLGDVPRAVRYDLTHVPLVQLERELHKREKARASKLATIEGNLGELREQVVQAESQLEAARVADEVNAQRTEVFEAALDAVEAGQPQPPAPPEWRHAGS